jgi:hypothetical protein
MDSTPSPTGAPAKPPSERHAANLPYAPRRLRP